ncbi:MAG: bifunctional (p)ppGpp synthetase/guanosine-3',5'-bis(diphosphate) 3'-pyrophosphohydrolase, partial [Deferribacteraceae bacterium]|nr:bifunctional (p)ppGpp synthetase/guanosine-3',5'-bis(diphosphate) 3'-pyrophosphohydrolase [Deferribacteraceae bacterium]
NLVGKDVAFLVDGMTKISKIEFKSKEDKQAENFRKMLLSMTEDVRVILIKLADRLHNMRTIDSLRPDKQVRIAEETMGIYAPLADRLGIAWVKWELEDLSFRVLNHEMYQEISQKIKLNRTDREQYLDRVREMVCKELENQGINGSVAGRPKHFYSIYNKMIKKQTTFEDIFDLLALRVLVDTVSQCYGVLGIIHSLFRPIEGKIKDYISMPKANMYQSLHTTVMGPGGQIVEFQIRTNQMHHIAEEGIAAHWKYKEGKAFNPKEDKQFVQLRQLLEQKDGDSKELVESLKGDFLQAQIYVFTPDGDVVELPVGSVPIDFAYAVHSEVGNKYSGAKVNGRIVNLRYKLQSGDKLEIITSPTQEPRKDWLDVAKTSRAKTRIRAYLRKKDSERAIAEGFSLLEREFKERGGSFKTVIDTPADIAKVFDKTNTNNIDELYSGIGFGMISPFKVVHLFYPTDERTDERVFKSRATTAEPFYIDGVDGMMMKIARCCNPLPGDDIDGYVSTGRGIIVHKRDCVNLRGLAAINKDRLVDVAWSKEVNFHAPVKITAITRNTHGMMNEITEVVKNMKINFVEYSAKFTGGGESEHKFSVEIHNKEEINLLLTKLSQIEGMIEVKRA